MKIRNCISSLDTIFEILGGVPKTVISDNMKTIMDEARTNYSSGKINVKFDQFSKDYQFILKPCVAGRPSSKGKVETQMKLLDEIHAYQGKLTLEELNEKIQQINLRKNMDIHSGTGKSPITLLNIEKDSLQPLPTKAIRSPYQRYRQLYKVNQSSMITYQSNQYSVPAEYIGKSLLLESDNESLYIYDSIKLVVIHPIRKGDERLLFQLIDRRYENKSTIITTNLTFDKWNENFNNSFITNAILN